MIVVLPSSAKRQIESLAVHLGLSVGFFVGLSSIFFLMLTVLVICFIYSSNRSKQIIMNRKFPSNRSLSGNNVNKMKLTNKFENTMSVVGTYKLNYSPQHLALRRIHADNEFEKEVRFLNLERGHTTFLEQWVPGKVYQTQRSPLREFRIFVINLPETEMGQKRMKLMNTTVWAPFMEVFHGIYGKTYDYSTDVRQRIINTHWNYGKWKGQRTKIIAMTPGEIGVSLSHYRIWEKIVFEGIPKTIILEDDSSHVCSGFERKLEIVLEYLPDDWDIFLISFWLHQGDDGHRVNDYISRVNNFVFLNCYAVSLKGARKLIKNTPINMPVDSWIASLSKSLKIYRHHFQSSVYDCRGLLVWQASKKEVGSAIDHTNNW